VAVTRLTGGLSPADGADPRTFPQIWNATADDIEQVEADVVTLESDVDFLQSGFVSHGTSTGGTVALNFSSGNALVSHEVSGTAVAITGASYSAGFSRTVRLYGGTAIASLSVPADWVFVGNAAGTSIGTATTVVVTATSFGTAASQVVAAYAEEA